MSVTTISEKRIFPKSVFPSQNWPLAVTDLIMPPVYIKWISFYETDNSPNFMSSDLLALSLSKLLDLYPLLAGNFVRLPFGHSQIEYVQDNLQGCAFSCATSDVTLASLREANFSIKSIPSDIINGKYMFPVPGSPILAVQHTKLACGSVVMGYSMHHQVGDGFSVQNFVEKWSKICRGISVETPILDRTILAANSSPLLDHPEYKIVEPTPPPPAPSGVPMPESVRVIVRFSPDKIVQMKNSANSSLHNGKWVSTNDCAVSLVWRAMSRARGLKEGDKSSCGFAVDGRKKFPLKDGDMKQYFGNFIMYLKASADAGTLIKSSLGEAALIVREQVEKLDSARIQSAINWITQVPDKSHIQWTFSPFLGNDIFLSGWQAFPMYDSDFGWGKPKECITYSQGVDGIAVIVPKGPSAEVDKHGFEVVLGVIKPNLERFTQDPELTKFASIILE